MEFFRKVEKSFDRIDGELGTMHESIQRMQEGIQRLDGSVSNLKTELQEIRGAFAGIEAMLIAQAARERSQDEKLAEYGRRIETLEKRAS